MSQPNATIWFITGISSGLGKALAEAVMQHGDFVVGTFRLAEQVADFNVKQVNQGFALLVDIAQPDQIRQAVQTFTERFGKIDVLVNNAGYGFAGAVEEASELEIRAVFNVNFFGTLAVTQAFLPMFRQQNNGHIIQISSQAGVKAMAGFGVYNASKFALEGMSEALLDRI
ncbi:SDR family NAD(P)-dependent oxidoreductase [Spirosoma aerolatum]|uniref:SDR family NAD(P)-dependent oxidoreductase n=1 Tax=Spirosoma aerolatum TaxID=1211326 RepID=UPI0009AD67B2|nr:SDR family NAD(P)-dependent oxidoreductase [Spirosoma aerolatum]